MIPQQIQALFDFIDFLDLNKEEFIEKYIPLCDELIELDFERSKLKPRSNYIHKQKHDAIQKVISEKFEPIAQNIYIPITNKLKDLGIWSGDAIYTSIWNNNTAAIHDFKESFEMEDVEEVLSYKHKYLKFRKETNSNFLCLQIILSNLDDIFKELFDFFKDSEDNEFESFETKTIEAGSFKDAIISSIENKGRNVRFSIPHDSLYQKNKTEQSQVLPTQINQEIIMNKYQIGDISNNSGQIIVGSHIKISNSLNEKTELANKIGELINLIRREENVNDEQRQALITNFDKVREEILEDKPVASKISNWLSTTKGVLDTLVISHEVTQAVQWVYKNLNFIG